MTIRIYPSLLPGEPIETHEWDGTVGDWMRSKGIDYEAHEVQPVAVFKAGVLVHVDDWATTSGDVEIRLLPHGGIFKALGSIIGKIFNAVFGWLMPKSAGFDRQDTPQGQKLESAQAKANQAKLNQVVPELAGTFRRFPDYLTPPRRHFVNLREQWLEFHACIGPGHYQIDATDVRVGDTPFSGLGGDGAYEIFAPGTDLSAVSTHEHWHTVDEVGGTSSGTPGLELPVDMAAKDHTPASSYVFSADTITIPPGKGGFPSGWGPGTLIDVRIMFSYSITRYQTGPAEGPYYLNRISGRFDLAMPISVDMPIFLYGATLSGQYKVRASSVNASGLGWIELNTMAGEPVGNIPPSTTYDIQITNGKLFRLKSSSDFVVSVERINGDGSIDSSWSSFPSLTSSLSNVTFAGGLVYGKWTSTFAACPPSETTSLIEVDFFLPGGLAEIDDDGSLKSRTVRAEIQYRDMNTPSEYVSILKTYTQQTLDQIGFTEQIWVSSMRPEVRVRRVGATSTSTQIQDAIHWYGLKSRLPTRTSYPNWTTMSVKIRSGGRLAAQAENQINVIATRMLPTLQPDGTWGPQVPTRDISAFARYIAQTIGYTDDDLYIGEFQRLHAVWGARGDTLDHVFDETTVKDALNVAFGAGMAELTIDDGQIRPVRDEPRTRLEQGYSPQNITGPLRRRFTAPKPDDPDGVEVEYIDERTWTTQTVLCLLPGDRGFKLERIKIDGVTNRNRAYRIGMRRRCQLRYRRWEYAFATEMDALNSKYLSYVPLVGEDPGYGQSMLLEGIEPVEGGALLHVSEPLQWEDGQAHVLAYRRPDGTVAGPFEALPGPDERSVIAALAQPWPKVTLKMEPPHIYFGTLERWSFPALITDIRPQGMEAASVSATNYDERVYQFDNSNAPN